MSYSYEPISLDSDHEDEHTTNASENETRSTNRHRFFQPRARDSEVESGEDGNVSTEYHNLPPADRGPDPPADRRLPASYRLWSRTLRTLQRWRDRIPYTPIPGEGVSSSVRQEFLLDTTPVIVDRVSQHDQRLDMTEDIIMDMPGSEQFGDLRRRMDYAEGNMTSVDSRVQNLEARMEAMTQEFRNLETNMERRMNECHTMTAMAQGIAQDQIRQFFQ